MVGRITDLISGLALIGLGSAVWRYAATFPQLDEGHPGPSLFPRLIAVGLIGCGLALGLLFLRRQHPPKTSGHALPLSAVGLGRVLLCTLIIAAYPLLRNQLGFVPTVGLFVFVLTTSLRTRWLQALWTAVITSVGVYFIFTTLLGVPL